MDLRGTKLVLVGGGGLIGSHTAEKLLEEGVAELLIYGRLGNRRNLARILEDSRVRIAEGSGDVLDEDGLLQAFSGAHGVFHFAAAWMLQSHEAPRSAFDVNVRGTFNVIEAAASEKISRLVFSSSAAVYGEAEVLPIKETHPLAATTFYGATKIAGEAMLRAYHHRYGLDYVGLRYMNVYGPRQVYRGPYASVIMKMLEAIERGEGPTIYGNGAEAFDFVAVEDCALANVRAMQATVSDAMYNIGTGKGTSLRDLAELLIELTKANVPINFAPGDARIPVKSRIGCTRRAAQDLGFRAQMDIREGLERLIAWRAVAMAPDARDNLSA